MNEEKQEGAGYPVVTPEQCSKLYNMWLCYMCKENEEAPRESYAAFVGRFAHDLFSSKSGGAALLGWVEYNPAQGEAGGRIFLCITEDGGSHS